eukprot:jgi/Botrbrau1/2821/Bobra.0125s0031.2
MPTGGGKSLCYIMPALVSNGIVLVVSPLIALMENQVQSISSRGISCNYLSSTRSDAERRSVLRGLQEGRSGLKLLFVTPESCQTDTFLSVLKGLYSQKTLSLFAIDEAHCISSWGHDFRPAYCKLGRLRREFPAVPIMALTATAASQVREDIITHLRLRSPRILVSSFNRPNIHYSVRYLEGSKTKMQSLVDVLGSNPSCSIIYVLKRDTADAAAAFLSSRGLAAEAYHAGLKDAKRSSVLSDWTRGAVPIVAATIAFGMGIDKADVRCVIHMDLPKTMAGFYQESGRAGRDGLPARSILFYDEDDRARMDWILGKQAKMRKSRKADGEEGNAQKQFAEVVKYAKSDSCRRAFVLHHFGERLPPGTCSGCDCCENPSLVKEQLDLLYQNTMGRRFSRSRSSRWGNGDDQADRGWKGHGDDSSAADESDSEEEAETAEEAAARQIASKARKRGATSVLDALQEEEERFLKKQRQSNTGANGQKLLQKLAAAGGRKPPGSQRAGGGAAVSGQTREHARSRLRQALLGNPSTAAGSVHIDQVAAEMEEDVWRSSGSKTVYMSKLGNTVRRAAALPGLSSPQKPPQLDAPGVSAAALGGFAGAKQEVLLEQVQRREGPQRPNGIDQQAGTAVLAAADVAVPPVYRGREGPNPAGSKELGGRTGVEGAEIERGSGSTSGPEDGRSLCTADRGDVFRSLAAVGGANLHKVSSRGERPDHVDHGGGVSSVALHTTGREATASSPSGKHKAQQSGNALQGQRNYACGIEGGAGLSEQYAAQEVGGGSEDDMASALFEDVQGHLERYKSAGGEAGGETGEAHLCAALEGLEKLSSVEVSADLLRRTGMGKSLKALSKSAVPRLSGTAAKVVTAFKRSLIDRGEMIVRTRP